MAKNAGQHVKKQFVARPVKTIQHQLVIYCYEVISCWRIIRPLRAVPWSQKDVVVPAILAQKSSSGVCVKLNSSGTKGRNGSVLFRGRRDEQKG